MAGRCFGDATPSTRKYPRQRWASPVADERRAGSRGAGWTLESVQSGLSFGRNGSASSAPRSARPSRHFSTRTPFAAFGRRGCGWRAAGRTAGIHPKTGREDRVDPWPNRARADRRESGRRRAVEGRLSAHHRPIPGTDAPVGLDQTFPSKKDARDGRRSPQLQSAGGFRFVRADRTALIAADGSGGLVDDHLAGCPVGGRAGREAGAARPPLSPSDRMRSEQGPGRPVGRSGRGTRPRVGEWSVGRTGVGQGPHRYRAEGAGVAGCRSRTPGRAPTTGPAGPSEARPRVSAQGASWRRWTTAVHPEFPIAGASNAGGRR